MTFLFDSIHFIFKLLFFILLFGFVMINHVYENEGYITFLIFEVKGIVLGMLGVIRVVKWRVKFWVEVGIKGVMIVRLELLLFFISFIINLYFLLSCLQRVLKTSS